MSGREVFELHARVTLDQPRPSSDLELDRLHELLGDAVHDALQSVTEAESDRGVWTVNVEVQ